MRAGTEASRQKTRGWEHQQHCAAAHNLAHSSDWVPSPTKGPARARSSTPSPGSHRAWRAPHGWRGMQSLRGAPHSPTKGHEQCEEAEGAPRPMERQWQHRGTVPYPASTCPRLPCSQGDTAGCWHQHQARATSGFYRNEIKPWKSCSVLASLLLPRWRGAQSPSCSSALSSEGETTSIILPPGSQEAAEIPADTRTHSIKGKSHDRGKNTTEK